MSVENSAILALLCWKDRHHAAKSSFTEEELIDAAFVIMGSDDSAEISTLALLQLEKSIGINRFQICQCVFEWVLNAVSRLSKAATCAPNDSRVLRYLRLLHCILSTFSQLERNENSGQLSGLGLTLPTSAGGVFIQLMTKMSSAEYSGSCSEVLFKLLCSFFGPLGQNSSEWQRYTPSLALFKPEASAWISFTAHVVKEAIQTMTKYENSNSPTTKSLWIVLKVYHVLQSQHSTNLKKTYTRVLTDLFLPLVRLHGVMAEHGSHNASQLEEMAYRIPGVYFQNEIENILSGALFHPEHIDGYTNSLTVHLQSKENENENESNPVVKKQKIVKGEKIKSKRTVKDTRHRSYQHAFFEQVRALVAHADDWPCSLDILTSFVRSFGQNQVSLRNEGDGTSIASTAQSEKETKRKRKDRGTSSLTQNSVERAVLQYVPSGFLFWMELLNMCLESNSSESHGIHSVSRAVQQLLRQCGEERLYVPVDDTEDLFQLRKLQSVADWLLDQCDASDSTDTNTNSVLSMLVDLLRIAPNVFTHDQQHRVLAVVLTPSSVPNHTSCLSRANFVTEFVASYRDMRRLDDLLRGIFTFYAESCRSTGGQVWDVPTELDEALCESFTTAATLQSQMLWKNCFLSAARPVAENSQWSEMAQLCRIFAVFLQNTSFASVSNAKTFKQLQQLARDTFQHVLTPYFSAQMELSQEQNSKLQPEVPAAYLILLAQLITMVERLDNLSGSQILSELCSESLQWTQVLSVIEHLARVFSKNKQTHVSASIRAVCLARIAALNDASSGEQERLTSILMDLVTQRESILDERHHTGIMVDIRHHLPLFEPWMTPDQARDLAEFLLRNAATTSSNSNNVCAAVVVDAPFFELRKIRKEFGAAFRAVFSECTNTERETCVRLVLCMPTAYFSAQSAEVVARTLLESLVDDVHGATNDHAEISSLTWTWIARAGELHGAQILALLGEQELCSLLQLISTSDTYRTSTLSTFCALTSEALKQDFMALEDKIKHSHTLFVLSKLYACMDSVLVSKDQSELSSIDEVVLAEVLSACLNSFLDALERARKEKKGRTYHQLFETASKLWAKHIQQHCTYWLSWLTRISPRMEIHLDNSSNTSTIDTNVGTQMFRLVASYVHFFAVLPESAVLACSKDHRAIAEQKTGVLDMIDRSFQVGFRAPICQAEGVLDFVQTVLRHCKALHFEVTVEFYEKLVAYLTRLHISGEDVSVVSDVQTFILTSTHITTPNTVPVLLENVAAQLGNPQRHPARVQGSLRELLNVLKGAGSSLVLKKALQEKSDEYLLLVIDILTESADRVLTEPSAVETAVLALRLLCTIFSKQDFGTLTSSHSQRVFFALQNFHHAAISSNADSTSRYQLQNVWVLMYILMSRVIQYHTHTVSSSVPHFMAVLRMLFQVLKQENCAENEIESFASNLARLFGYMKPHGSIFRKYLVYFMMDYVDAASSGQLSVDVQNALKSGLFELMDICSSYEFEQLHTILDGTGKTIFKSLHQEYKAEHQYIGKN